MNPSKADRSAAREYLSAALYIDAMIAVKLARADQMRQQARRMPGKEVALHALEEEILADYSALLERKRQLEEAIRRVPQEVVRLVLESHYLQGEPFFRIAMRLNYDVRQIYRFHIRGLDHVAAQMQYGWIPK